MPPKKKRVLPGSGYASVDGSGRGREGSWTDTRTASPTEGSDEFEGQEEWKEGAEFYIKEESCVSPSQPPPDGLEDDAQTSMAGWGKRAKAPSIILTLEQQESIRDWFYENECLYDRRHPQYLRARKDQLWAEKAEELRQQGVEGITGRRLNTWVTGVRTDFSKLTKDTRKSGAGGSEQNKPTARMKWVLEKWGFLEEHIYRRRPVEKEAVRHSQSMNATPLKPWLIARPNGTVESAHCDCMAGLGEACSHVGAVLFYVDHVYQARSRLTVTQTKAYWPVPTYVDKVPLAEIRDIDFTSVETKRKQVECSIMGEQMKPRSGLKLPEVPESSSEEVSALDKVMFQTKDMPSILSVKSEYQEHYVPDILRENKLPLCLATLKNETHLNAESDKLKQECVNIFSDMKVTEEQARNAEIITRGQAKSKEWHALRQGRITASIMKSVCSGSVEKPAISTVNGVCGSRKFSSKATKWGCDHEQTALSLYASKMANEHINLKVDKCGLFINPNFPHLGASPDATVQCDCCGEGVVEIKCPYCARDSNINDSDNGIGYLENGKLRHNHQYYFQVQTQLLVSRRLFCDFVVWTQKDMAMDRIESDPELQQLITSKSRDYFVKVILPEITGSLITRQIQTKQQPREQLAAMNSNSQGLQPSSSKETLICKCQTKYNPKEDVIGCDDENCTYVWFHLSCLKIKRIPKGKYFCPDCKKRQPKRQRKQ